MMLVDTIRESVAYVAQHADHVTVNDGRLRDYVARLDELELPSYDTTYHYQADIDNTLLYILCLDAINFGSGYFPYLQKLRHANGDIMAGYYTVARHLTRSFEQNVWDIAMLKDISLERVAAIFQQEINEDNVASRRRQELMKLFVYALNDLGEWLEQHSQNNIMDVLQHAAGSADAFMKRLIEMPFYQDVSDYKGEKIALYKRAQITVSDIAMALPHVAEAQFADIDSLTMFADNLVPHVLWVEGLLEYSPELRRTLDLAQRLPANSAMEVEIRAVSVHAIEKLAEYSGISPRYLDILLWEQGQNARYREQWRHRTKTVFY